MADPTLTITPEVRETLRQLLESAEADKNVDWCERCGNPIWPQDQKSTADDVTGCWFVATAREKDRPSWCFQRQEMMRVVGRGINA